MKRIILIAGFLVFLSFSGKAQQKIIHTFDKHDRLKSSELPDSLIFKQTYDNVGNPILDFIINPCYDRPDPVILYTSPLIFCQGDSVILTAPPSLKYLWSTSDTTRSIIVKNAGFYFLTTFNTLNCTKTSSPVEVKVNSLPNPQILASGPTTFCQGSNVTLTSSLTGVYLWSNGKASKSIVADSAQNYILTVTDSNGCKNSVSQTVSFYSQPSVGFNINKEKQCKANHAFDFENTSSISSGSLTYKWDFGDGNTSTLTNVTDKNYTASSGNYLVKLICTSNNGCKDSLTKSVTVYPNPVSAFTISKPTQCFNGHNFGLVNNTTLSSGSITYLWSFGDSKTDTLANPSKKYISYGTYSIQLVSISNNGCRDSITKTVIVFASPKADFTVNNDKQCKNGHIFNFINNSSIDSDSMTYLWDHGDGTDTTSMNSNGKTYSAPYGAFLVNLLSISTNGCRDSVSKTVTVYASPVAGFKINNDKQCWKNHSFDFSNTSSIASGSSIYKWNHGDGSTDTSTNSNSKNYSSFGTYFVNLIATSNNGCKDSVQKAIRVYASPKVGFTINSDKQCFSGHSFDYNNTSSISEDSLKYLWNTGQGLAYTKNITNKSYSSFGNYSVKLLATSTNGCRDSASKTVIVHPQASANFSVNDSSQCHRINKFIFTNKSIINNSDTITSYEWNFREGSGSSSKSPQYSYTNYGSFKVTMTTKSNNGCIDSTSRFLVVHPQAIVDFKVNDSTQCNSIDTFLFTNKSKIPTRTIAYNWSFGDSTNGINNIDSLLHSYSVYGTYQVKLKTISDKNCQDSLIKQVIVYPQATIKNSLNYTEHCNANDTFKFVEKSLVPIGNISKTIWRFGDSTSSYSTNPNHSYKYAKIYRVTHITETDEGCIDSAYFTVTVHPQPHVVFSVNKNVQCFVGHSFNFDNNSNLATGTAQYYWSFGDGTFDTLKNIQSKKYAIPNTYPVKLIITSGFGCKDSLSKNLLLNPNPTAGFSISQTPQCFKDHIFNLFNTSTIVSGTMTYQWKFGDSKSDTLTNPKKQYSKFGKYTIELEVTSNNGCKDTISKSVVVHASPAVEFDVNNDKQCWKDHSFDFTNKSVIDTGSNSYVWFLGDGNTTSSSDVYGKYYSAIYGTYNVKLVANSNYGCKDSIRKSITVYSSPKVGFTINKDKQCKNGHSFDFTNTSKIDTGTITFKWDHGDGTNSISTNSTKKTFSALSGTYSIKLTALSDKGCKDSSINPVTVFANNSIAFKINKDKQCFNGHSFDFTDSSKGANIANYLWSFGDSSNSNSKNVTNKKYNKDSLYTVIFITTTDNGCMDTAQNTVTVFASPIAQFDIAKLTQCIKNNSNDFINKSSIRTGSIPNYFWTLGDGDLRTTVDVIGKKYTLLVDSFKVDLLTISNNKCRDSISKFTKVFPNSVIGFKINDSIQCYKGHDFSYTNTSTIQKGSIMGYIWNLGEGSFETNKDILSKKYSLDSIYEITLISQTDKNCFDTLSKIIIIHPNPIDTFITSPETQCLKNNTTFLTSKSKIRTGNIATHYWDFDDGTNTSKQGPHFKSYGYADTFWIMHRTISNFGCRDSTRQNVIIYPQAILDFYTDKDTQCFKVNNFTFYNKSKIQYGTLTFQWDHGDGTPNTNKDTLFNKRYIRHGDYNITLTSTSDQKCIDMFSKTIKVNPNPKADFIIDKDKQCFKDNNFNFYNSSSIVDKTKMRFYWELGDGRSASDSNIINFKYPSEDSFNVRLIVYSNFGCSDTIELETETYPQPIASFTIPKDSQCIFNNNFTFTNTSLKSKNIWATYHWDFGDSRSSNLTDATNQYDSFGVYQITLKATSQFGCIHSATDTVVVNPKPTVNFDLKTDSAQCLHINLFGFKNKTEVETEDTLSYIWDFGDSVKSQFFEPVHKYDRDRQFIVKLIAITEQGCKDSLSNTVTVHPEPNVSFSVQDSLQCLLDNRYVYTSTSSINSGTLSKAIWNLGEGLPKYGSRQEYSYLNFGTYRVVLVEESDKGCKDSSNKEITVYPQPKAKIGINDSTQCFGGHIFLLTDSSTIASGQVSRSNWQFSDGFNSTNRKPEYSFATYGNYRVWLETVSDFDCKDSTSKVVTVYRNPAKPIITHQGNLLISSNNKGNAWYRNGQRIDTLKDQSIIATESGRYIVITTNSENCDSISDPFDYRYNGIGNFGLIVYPNPNSGTFTINATVKIDRFIVFDATGKIVHESNQNLNVESINIEKVLASGKYFIQVFSGNEFETQKVTIIE